MKVELIESDEAFTALRPEWDSVLQASLADDIFITWEYLHTWWAHYGSRYKLHILAARDADGQLLAVAPLMQAPVRCLGLRLRVLRNIGLPAPDVSGVFYLPGREDALTALTDWLIQHRTAWDALLLREVPTHSLDVAAWAATFPKTAYVSRCERSLHYRLALAGDWDSYTKRLGGLRKELNYQVRRLVTKYQGRYEHKRGQAAAQDMDTVFQVNQKARFPYLYRDETARSFHRELARVMAERGWLDLYFYYLANIPIAFFYGFWYRDTFEYWRSGYDRDYAQHSPGKALLYLIIQDGYEHGMRYLDFLQGDEESKLKWQVEEREYAHVSLVRKSFLSLLVLDWIPRFKITIRDLLRSHSWLHPIYRLIAKTTNFVQNHR